MKKKKKPLLNLTIQQRLCMKLKSVNYKRLDYNGIKSILSYHSETLMNKPKYSIRKIAKIVGRDKRTVSAVINNYKTQDWDTSNLHKKTAHIINMMRNNRKTQGRKSIMESDSDIYQQVKNLIIEERKSPYQASIALNKGCKTISKSSIYRFTKHKSRDLIPFLPLRGKIRKQRVKHRRSRFNLAAPRKINISERKDLANLRLEFGHWECDTVVSCKDGSNYAVLSMIERVSRYKKYFRIPNLKSETVYAYMLPFLLSLPRELLKSLTFDNGSEFSTRVTNRLTDKFEDLKLYYCDPFSSHQKGAVERSNLDLRMFFPKGTDFANVTFAEILRAERKINNRHLKVLSNRTPLDIFEQFIINHYSKAC